MKKQSIEDLERAQQGSPKRRQGPLRWLIATLLLMFGALLGRLSNLCTSAGILWVGDTGARELARALEYMRSGQSPSARAPHWEQQLLRVGPSMVIGVGGALIALAMLLVLGGALAWLAIHGYGLPVMLLAMVVGALIGGRRARLVRNIPPPERMN